MAQRQVLQVAILALVAGAVVGGALAVGVLGVAAPGSDSPDEPSPDDDVAGSTLGPDQTTQPLELLDGQQSAVDQFGSEDAFREYVRAGQRQEYGNWWSPGGRFVTFDGELEGDVAVAEESGGVDGDDGARDAADAGGEGSYQSEPTSGPDRVGETNVQVAGLDEPDTVKTDGQNFYYSPMANRYGIPVRGWEDDAVAEDDPYEVPEPATHVIDITEPSDPDTIADVNANGKLLQTGDTLIVIEESNNRIVGYDVSDPSNPTVNWTQQLEDNLVTAREAGGQLYVVTQTGLDTEPPCPIEPLGEDAAIPCGEIYAPNVQTAAESTYTAFSIDAASGTIDDSVSMVGSGDNTVVYMSHHSLYLTYTTGISEAELRASWASESPEVPAELAARISEINSYNITQRSKRAEIELAVDEWVNSLPEDERSQRRDDLQKSYEDYLADNQENLTQTSIVKVDVDESDLTVGQTGTVPGEPLNQFALDEYEGTLRIATTIPRVRGLDSTNHMYVLDNESLNREDRITGMGEDQRITSVRYEGDTAYLVTFRQIDPFYVIDFEDPRDPKKLGELELPGFSSYLHPVDDNYVIGIGEEDWNVKAALFDVSDPTNPQVADDLLLDAGWSAIDESHHAFMMDRRHEVFFLPAENSGKVVDYADGELDVVKEVEASSEVTRARYVDDYLYVFAGQEVIVLDQTNWERTTTLRLDRDDEEVERPESGLMIDATNTGGPETDGGWLTLAQESEEVARSESETFPENGIEIIGSVDEESGTWESTTVNFPPVGDNTALPIQVTAPDGLSGEYDEANNRMTVEGELEIRIPEGTLTFTIEATTGDSGALSGEADLESGTATLVDNEFTIPDTTDNEVINESLGLPIEEPGQNWLVLPLEFDIENVDE